MTARSWLEALGKAMEELSQTATLNDLQVTRNDSRTWTAQERGTPRRYLVIDAEADPQKP